ncbi:MAG: GNAT family N-acetyltransferase [Acidimicrobiales bacterium]
MTRSTIRQAHARDAPEAASVYLAARHRSVPDIPPLVHSDDEVRAWFRDVVVPRQVVWVAVVDDSLVGLLALEGAHVEHLYVAPGHTDQGVGSELLDHAKSLQPAGLHLVVFESNVGARGFYRRHGFVELERTDGSGNEEGAPDIACRWSPPS